MNAGSEAADRILFVNHYATIGVMEILVGHLEANIVVSYGVAKNNEQSTELDRVWLRILKSAQRWVSVGELVLRNHCCGCMVCHCRPSIQALDDFL